jgi:predicted DNA-binding transcriptional regulator
VSQAFGTHSIPRNFCTKGSTTSATLPPFPENGAGEDDSERRSIAESQLKGNTLRVYVYVVTHKQCGVREIQRALHLSSSSLAQYHLSKLVDLGLLKSNETGEYFLTDQVRVDVLKDFLKLGAVVVPRFVFYAVFFTILTVFLGIVAFRNSLLLIDIFFEALLAFASALFWYEALRAWIRGPV